MRRGSGGALPCWEGLRRAGSRETRPVAPALPRAAALAAAAAAPCQSLAGNGGGLAPLRGLRAAGQRSRARGAASCRRFPFRLCGMCRDLPPGRRVSIAAATR